MVKYLSDQRNDPYYQTKLSLSQPFEAEVPQKMYPVDEVDLGPALGMIEAGARAYYAHQGEELERDNMAISYSMYQANRAEAQAKQKQAANKEKETGLKNTIFNDYSAYVNAGIEAFNQKNGITTREQLERYIRDGRQQYLKNTGGVVNANDLISVEKNMGLTLTKDLFSEYSAAVKKEAELQVESERNAERAIVNDYFGVDNTTGKPVADRFNNYEVTQMAAGLNKGYNALAISANTDALNNLSEPSKETKESIHDFAYRRAQARKLSTDGEWTWTDVEKNISEMSDEIMTIAAENDIKIDPNMALFYAKQAAKDAGYYGPVTLSDAMLDSMLSVKKKRSEYATLDSSTEAAMLKNINDKRYEETVIAIANGDPVTAQNMSALAIDKRSNLADLINKNPDVWSAVKETLGSIKVENNPTGTTGGAVLSRTVQKLPDGQKQQVAQAAYEQARYIYDGKTIFGKYAGPYGAGLALESIHNQVTTVQPQDSDADNTQNQNTAQRITNTERLAIPAFRKWYEDGTLDMMSEEEQAVHYNNYMKDIAWAANSRMTTLKNAKWLDNVRYDPKSKKFVVVNIGEDKESLVPVLTGAETLWPQVNALNDYFGTPVNYKGLYSTDAKRDNLIAGYGIKELSPEDKIMTKSKAIQLMEYFQKLDDNTPISKTGVAAGATIGFIGGGLPGAMLGGALGTAGSLLPEAAWELSISLLDTFTGTPSATKKLMEGGTWQDAMDEMADSLGYKAVATADKYIAEGLNLGGEAFGEAVNAAEKIGEYALKGPETVAEKITTGLLNSSITRNEDPLKNQPEMLVNAYDKLNYKGNIDLFDRTYLPNNDGSVSSLESITIEQDGKYINIPTIVNGERLSEAQAIAHYQITGENLGSYTTKKKAETAAKKISDFEDLRYRWLQNYNKIPNIDSRQRIMNSILEGNTEGLTTDDAESALDYYKSLGPIDKFKLGAYRGNTPSAVFSNPEYILNRAVDKIKKHEKVRSNIAQKVDNMAPMNAEAIYNIAKGAKNVSKEEAEAALKAWNKATITDKNIIERNLNMYSSEIKKALEDATQTTSSSYSEVTPQSNSTQRKALSSTVTDHSIPEDVMKEIPSVADALNVKEVDILDKLAAESSMGKQAGTSKAGAKGLMQVTNVAKEEVLKDKEIMKDIKEAYPNFKGNISDPLDNIILGAGYMKICEKIVDKKCAANGVRLSQKDKNDLVRVVYNHGTGSGLNKIIDTIKEHPKDWKDRKPFSNYKNYLAMQDYKRFVK